MSVTSPFQTREAQPGGLAGVTVRHQGRGRLGIFVDVETKSAGWAQGVISLDRNVSARAGLSLLLH